MGRGQAPRATARSLATLVVERDMELAGHRTRVLEHPGARRPVVLLHGARGSADGWRPVLERLGGGGHRAIALDLPGLGETSEPAGERLLRACEDVVAHAVCRYARRRRPILVGDALGGLVALRVAGQQLVPVGGVVPVAPPAQPPAVPCPVRPVRERVRSPERLCAVVAQLASELSGPRRRACDLGAFDAHWTTGKTTR